MPQVPENAEKPGSRGYHHGDLRSALVAEARALLESEGADAVSLRGVARALGVSRAAPYHHFKDKRALLAAVAADGLRDLARHMLARAADAATPKERLSRLGVGYVEFGVHHPALFRLVEGPAFAHGEVPPDLAAARAESFAPLVEAVRACLPGESEARIRLACAAAWSLVHGMATLCNDQRLASLVDLSNLDRTALDITRHLDIGRGLRPSDGG